MKQRYVRDVGWCREYSPDELAATPDAPKNARRATELAMLIRLMGTSGESGPLMAACQKAAEYRDVGGHSPRTRRRAHIQAVRLLHLDVPAHREGDYR